MQATIASTTSLSKSPKTTKKHSDPNLSLEINKLIAINALKVHNQMKIFKRRWWKEINQVIQIISKIGQVIQLAVNYCIRKAAGTPVFESVCHAVGNYDYKGVSIIMLTPFYAVAFPFRPLRNNQPVFFAAGTGKLPVQYPYTEKVYFTWSNRRPWHLCNLRGPKEDF